MMNTLYKERFPKATKQMEERLRNFILNNETLSTESEISAGMFSCLFIMDYLVTAATIEIVAAGTKNL